ncbi:hypothetical protein [Cellulomonas triticagri]|uniref:DUF1795 domain-containing protein n=1 Tax=Cellulomonas triticagri TaxID=2483352 RepID=A0A3M2JAC0_9CELL|nr:hypothetical protein [Cellulomonas triticagri]RMI09096.1 hypothetical protein EBM89_11730 [Cellulomonas triticagri]
MSTAAPDPALTLPDGWRTIPPEMVGAPGVVLVGAYETPDAGFTANVTVTVQVPDGPVDLPALATEAVRRMEAGARDVVLHRQDLAVDDAGRPALSQEIAFTADLGDQEVALVQTQDVVATHDEVAGAGRWWTVTLTASAGQSADLRPAVTDLVRRLRG